TICGNSPLFRRGAYAKRAPIWRWPIGQKGGSSMNRRHLLKAMSALAACPLCASAASAEGAHWSYEGTAGPDHWGDVDAASKVCTAGSQQSPIDITGAVKSTLPKLELSWSK